MKLILTIFKWGAAILCCFLILITIMLSARFAFSLLDNNPDSYITINNDNMWHEFVNNSKEEPSNFIYSADKASRYKRNKPTYTVDIKPNTSTGHYYMISTLLFMILGVMILLTFWKIFGQISLDAPFNSRVVRHLYLASYLFILAEVLGFIHYYILERLINSSVQVAGLHQFSEKGTNLFIGLLILIIAVVYKRGLEIYEDHSLTV